MVQNALGAWKQTMGQIDKTLAALDDEGLQREVAPGRNRVYYLLGHLTAVSDRLFPMLRLGERLHPELDEPFLTQPDRAGRGPGRRRPLCAAPGRRSAAKLLAAFEKLTPAEWLERHDSVSAEDFAKEPLRNRLAVLLSRSQHAAMHEGQMRLAKPR